MSEVIKKATEEQTLLGKRKAFFESERNLFVVVFALFLVTRLLAAPYFLKGEYHIDDALDSCIKPWQMLSGQQISGNDTNFLFFGLMATAYWLFGFSVEIAQLASLILFSISLGCFAVVWRRLFGGAAVFFMVLLSLVGILSRSLDISDYRNIGILAFSVRASWTLWKGNMERGDWYLSCAFAFSLFLHRWNDILFLSCPYVRFLLLENA